MKGSDNIRKTSDVHFRCREELKEQITVAAALAGKSVSEYCAEQLDAVTRLSKPIIEMEKRERIKRKDAVMNFRINKEDKKAIHEIAARAGLTDSEYMIRAALKVQTVVIVNGKELLHQISKIGTNLNQLTILAHQGKVTCPDLEDVNKTLKKVLKQLMHIMKDG